MIEVRRASSTLRALAVVAGLAACAWSCGPSEQTVQLRFVLEEADDVTRLEFVSTAIVGGFAGSTACEVGAGVVSNPDTDATITVTNGQLRADLRNVRRIDAGTVVVLCNYEPQDSEPEVSTVTRTCTYDVSVVSDDPDEDCPVGDDFENVVICGDGVVEGTEECDDGDDNSNTEADACRENCQEADCGDGVEDTGEECDDGNLVDNDECDNDCNLND